MRQTGGTFGEALRELARRAGVEVESNDDDASRRRREERETERERLLEALRVAARLFHEAFESSKHGEAARAYVASRGIGGDVVQRAGVGYAPNLWDALSRALLREGVSLAVAERAGLVGRRRSGEPFDRFRGRIMFPISDLRGNVIGFGGRVLPGEKLSDDGTEPPKFLNSPETPVFSKGANLYGLTNAREAIRSEGHAIVVEGYFDVLGLNEAGIWNVVAPLGTALTREQIQLLSRFTKQIVVVFDGDAAGERAALKALRPLLDGGVDGRVAVLPKGDDPDDFVRRDGRAVFESLVKAALPVLDHAIAVEIGRAGDTIPGRVRAAEALAPLLAAVESRLERSLYVKRIAERLTLDENEVARLVTGAGVGASDRATATRVVTIENDSGRPLSGATAVTSKGISVEERLVALLLECPTLADRLNGAELRFAFRQGGLVDIVERLQQLSHERAEAPATTVLDEIEDASLKARLLSIVMATPRTSESGEAQIARELEDCVARIRNDALKVEGSALKQAIADAQAKGDGDAVRRLLSQKAELAKRLTDTHHDSLRSGLKGKLRRGNA